MYQPQKLAIICQKGCEFYAAGLLPYPMSCFIKWFSMQMVFCFLSSALQLNTIYLLIVNLVVSQTTVQWKSWQWLIFKVHITHYKCFLKSESFQLQLDHLFFHVFSWLPKDTVSLPLFKSVTPTDSVQVLHSTPSTLDGSAWKNFPYLRVLLRALAFFHWANQVVSAAGPMLLQHSE